MKLRAAFIHSHIFIYDQFDTAFSEGKLTYETWERYLKHFDELIVMGRFDQRKVVSNLNVSSGENVQHIKLPNLSKLKNRMSNRNIAKRKIIECIENTDVVIARLPSVHGQLAVDIARQLKKPYVIELVGDVLSSYWFHGSVIGKVIAPYNYWQVKRRVYKAPYIFYVTEKFLQEKYPSKKNAYTCACSNVEITENIKLNLLQNKTSNKFIIGLIGSYSSKYKGIENALNVLKMLIEDGKEVELRILGSGDQGWILEKAKELRISEFLKLDGSLPSGKEVFNWLEKLNLYIQPSLTEGLPRALIEAMYCGLPCIASNVGGIPELLSETDLHAPKNEKKMYEKIIKMYTDSDYREEKSLINRKKAENYTKDILDGKRYYFWQKVVKDIKEGIK